jgi:hypothetical protein
MTVSAFTLGVLRLGAIVGPAWLTARIVVRAIMPPSRELTVLLGVVVMAAQLVVGGELLGLVGMLHSGSLAVLMTLAVAGERRRARPIDAPAAGRLDPGAGSAGGVLSPLLWLWVVAALVAEQWLDATGNVLGGGMLAFDSLWYHMPFAARFAQAGSVTAIQFTQADPFVAYYPANSELLHAVGILAFHNDFLSTLLSLVWVTLATVACWCIGRPWGVQRWTLLVGVAVVGLPVLSATQPGEGLNDITGLAFLLAGLAILLTEPPGRGQIAIAGLAFGLALGTKLTFVVPVAVAVLTAILALPAARRAARWLLASTALTGGWWYLRDLIATGSPIGLPVHLGPLTLAGPVSQLGHSVSGSVLSELGHTSLWGSRFAPGLAHALSPTWPVLVIGLVSVKLAALTRRDSGVRLLALVAAAAAGTYLVLPAAQGSLALANTAFTDTLRYVTPALATAAVLIPVLLRHHPRLLPWLGPTCAAIVLTGELHAHLWTPQLARHLAYLALAGVTLAVVIIRPIHLRALPRLAVIAVIAAGGYGLQRHYFARRYITGASTLDRLYAWAQQLPRTAIGVYGTVEDYPLSGRDSGTRVDYIGTPVSGGGYRPPAGCAEWRRAVNAANVRYLVLGGAPTAAIPSAWTITDPAARPISTPGPGITVYELTGPLNPSRCPAA